MARRAWFSSVLAVAIGCGTLGSAGGGDTDLPTIASGPFRALDDEELPDGTALTGLGLSDVPSGLALLPLPGGRRLLCYALAAGTDMPRAIHCAAREPTAVAFAHSAAAVLEADLAWEGRELFDPALALDGDGSVLLYYVAEGGIGAARSRDGGASFARLGDAPVALAAPAWATAPLRRPAVARFENHFRMYFDGGAGIGLARSEDGLSFTEIADRPVLRSGTAGRFDDAAVSAPFVRVEPTVSGRDRVSLWYGARDREDVGTIGYAASWNGLDFERLAIPVFGGEAEEADAAYDPRDAYSGLVYAVATRRTRRIVVVGISPGNASIAAAPTDEMPAP